MRQIYPRHFYEWIENEKAQALQTCNRAIEQIEEDKLTRENQYNLASELQAELDYLGYYSSFIMYRYSTRAEIAFSLHRHDTLSIALNKVIDICEDLFKYTPYEMQTDKTYVQDRSCYKDQNLWLQLTIFLILQEIHYHNNIPP